MKKLFNRPLRVLLFSNGLILVAGAMLGPIYAIFVERIGGDLLTASCTLATYYLMGGVTTLFSGRLADRVKNRSIVIIVGYCIMGFGFLCYTLVNSISSLLVVQVITGLGDAIYTPAFDATYSKHLDGSASGMQWGAYESLWYFAIAVAAISGGFLVSACSFNMMFIFMGFLCFASALYIYTTPTEVL